MRPDGERDIQQATTNLFADMGVLPSTPQPELQLSPPSEDASAPMVGPTAVRRRLGSGGEGPTGGGEGLVGTTHPEGEGYLLEGDSADEGGGVVAAVELSFDGGSSWSPAAVHPETGKWQAPDRDPLSGMGREGVRRVLARAADDSGNLSPAYPVSLSP
eukprot:2005849-Prymnesium_polylepis.2